MLVLTSSKPAERRLMAVMAHPDDESFGIGGTLALYARRGVDVHLVCATQGEVGEAPPGLKGFASKAEMRVAELRCASQILGLKSVNFLGYRDSGMPGSADNHHPQALAAAPLAEVARKIAAHIRQGRPQVMITFDPIGGYRHPDHIAVHQATVEAVRLAGDPQQALDLAPYFPQKLYFHTFPRRFLRMAVWLMTLWRKDPRRFGQNKDVDLMSLAEVEFPIHAVISVRAVHQLKEQAIACHASQGGNMPRRGPMRWAFRLFDRSETFMRAIPAEPPSHTERDLFDGVII